MGLDMYIMKVKKPTMNLDNVKTKNELLELGFSLIPTKKVLETTKYDDLKEYFVSVTVKVDCIDIEKIQKEFNIDEVSGYSRTSEELTISDDEGNKVKLTMNEVTKNYSYSKDETFYVFEEEEVHYWRKAFDIQNYLYEKYPCIENCGYTEIYPETLYEINDRFDEGIEVKYLEDDEAYFYHEWY